MGNQIGVRYNVIENNQCIDKTFHYFTEAEFTELVRRGACRWKNKTAYMNLYFDAGFGEWSMVVEVMGV